MINNYQRQAMQRLMAISSHMSSNSPRALITIDEETAGKQRCPHPGCGKIPKDLKAHMLCHESVRPEKCPIVCCEYYIKGFKRKYDRNRHTLSHYKGTMVCGFCPGSSSPAEKIFNRTDVFKRHLIKVHDVGKNPSNRRCERSPGSSRQDATGKCSTCSVIHDNAEDFYEHLDECVLQYLQTPAESETTSDTMVQLNG